MTIHLRRRSPDDSSGRPEGWAALPLPPANRGCTLLLGLAPGRVCRVSLRPTACAADRHRHCGTGPRLAADGRYPLPCAGELGLSSNRDRPKPAAMRGHPVASLARRFYALPPARLPTERLPACRPSRSPLPCAVSDRGGGRPTRHHPPGRDRSPRYTSRRRRSSPPGERGLPSTGPGHRGVAAPRHEAARASRP